jgi:hypothetical protein
MIGLLLYHNIGEAMKQTIWLNKANKNTMRIYFKLILPILGLGVVSTSWADTVCSNKVEGNTSCFTSEEYPGIDLSADRTNDSTDSTVEQPNKGFWSKLWGTPAPTALYPGMVTFHLEPGSRDDNWNNQLIAGTYKGYFAGTFINSFYDRGYAAGIQRMWDTKQLSDNVKNSVGYRLGLVSGYDERLAPIANKTPVLPFPQIIDDITWKHVGIELSWCVDTVSAGFVVTL